MMSRTSCRILSLVAISFLVLTSCRHVPFRSSSPSFSGGGGGSPADSLSRAQPTDRGRSSRGSNILASSGSLTSEERALVRAVEKVGGGSVEGRVDPTICAETRAYAQKMAQNRLQDGHVGFEERANAIGGSSQSEITAESWGWEGSVQEHADECVDSWMQSSGHADAMMRFQEDFCYSMAQGSNGRYYCVGLFTDGSGGGSGSPSTIFADTNSSSSDSFASSSRSVRSESSAHSSDFQSVHRPSIQESSSSGDC